MLAVLMRLSSRTFVLVSFQMISCCHNIIIMLSLCYSGTYDIQNIEINVKENNVTVTCWFARGTTARGFKIDILGIENHLVISKFISINETCVKSSCSYSVDVMQVGNFTTTVYNWKQDGGISRVYSREIVLTILKPTSTTWESTAITNMTDLDLITTVHWGGVTSILIAAGVIGGCSGGAVGCIIITVTLAVLFKKRRKKSNSE